MYSAMFHFIIAMLLQPRALGLYLLKDMWDIDVMYMHYNDWLDGWQLEKLDNGLAIEW